MKNKPLEFLWYNFLQTIIFITLILCLDDLFKLKLISNFLILEYVITLLILFLTTKSKYFIFAVLLLPFHPLLSVRINITIEEFVPFINSIVEYMGLIEIYNNYFQILVEVLFIPIYTLFYFLIYKKKRSLFLFILGGITFYGLYFYEMGNLNRAIIYFTTLLILYGYNNFKLNTHNISDYQKSFFIRWLTLIVIFVMATNLFIKVLPYKLEPLKNAEYESDFFSTIQGSGQPSQYSLTKTGFQPNPKKLGGSIKDDNTVAFYIETDKNYGELHLRGVIKDNYLNNMWTKSNSNLLNNAETEIYLADENLETFIKSNSSLTQQIEYKIIPKKLKVKNIFSTLYPYEVNVKGINQVFVNQEWDVFVNKNLLKSNEYIVKSVDYNYTKINDYVKSNKKIKGSIDNIQKEKYLQLNVNLPSRVKTLANEITQGYDQEIYKAILIERYLRANYSYSKEVDDVPDDRDFVDYFLFDEKRGYCTYFATAMTILCRTEGIPARFVEGFAVDVDAGKNEVLNNNAHAWVEVFIPQLGWVTFDPTPGHRSISDYINLPSKSNNVLENEENKIKEKINKESNKEQKQDIQEKQQEQEKEKIYKLQLNIKLFLPIAILVIYIIFYLLVIKKINRFDRIINKIIFYGKINGIKYEKSMSLKEYLILLGHQLSVDATKVIENIEERLYNKQKTSLKKIIDFENQIRIKTKQNNMIKYYFNILGYALVEPIRYVYVYFRKTGI